MRAVERTANWLIGSESTTDRDEEGCDRILDDLNIKKGVSEREREGGGQ